jgi:tetratricopeptide (TPR) repeat protein
MTSKELREAARTLIHQQRFGDALPLLRAVLEQDSSFWNDWYLAGQCHRFIGDIDSAISHLQRAAELEDKDAGVFLALGIALQLGGKFEEAIEAFRRALELDPDLAAAYNSLALTQKKAGQLEKALHNYDAGVHALVRGILKEMVNGRESAIFKHRDTEGTLWMQYAMHGATWLTVRASGISSVAFPTAEMAMAEERTEMSGGLYWHDIQKENEGTVRLFLPNYFNTLREALRRDISYANMIGNRGTVLGLLGRQEEARQHEEEAQEFEP